MRRTIVSSVVLLVFVLAAGVALAQEQAGSAAPAKGTSALVNLNSATSAQLQELPGIGARMAERIIDYRTKNGGFKKVEDLMNVQGIGEKNFLKLKSLITVGPAPKTEKAEK